MSTRFDAYRFVANKTPLSADVFNARWRDIDARLIALESISATLQAASDNLIELGLDRLNQTFQPLVDDLIELVETQGPNALQPENIGNTVQAHADNLDALAALSGAADKLAYFTGTSTLALATITATARSLLQAADKSAMRTVLELVPGSDVQAYSGALTEWASKGRPSSAVVGTTDSQTLSNKTLTQPVSTGALETAIAPTISSGALTLDCAAGNVFEVDLDADVTSLSFSNVPTSGTAFGAVLAFTADGTQRTITWPASVRWAGSEPALSSENGAKDIFVLTTWDAGGNWYATTMGQGF